MRLKNQLKVYSKQAFELTDKQNVDLLVFVEEGVEVGGDGDGDFQ